MYKPKYFSFKECFPYSSLYDWKYMDDRILRSADALREVFGSIWCNGMGLTQCGYRTNGSSTSQHRYGRAMDLHSNTYSSEEMRRYIIEHRDAFPWITFIEIDTSWLHIDCRNDLFKLWSPKRGFVTQTIYLKTGDV